VLPCDGIRPEAVDTRWKLYKSNVIDHKWKCNVIDENPGESLTLSLNILTVILHICSISSYADARCVHGDNVLYVEIKPQKLFFFVVVTIRSGLVS